MNRNGNIFLVIMLLVLQVQLYGTIQDNKNQTKKEINMEDRLDFSLLDKYARKRNMKDSIGEYVSYSWSFTENDTKTQLSGSTRNGITVWETPPSPVFFQIYKQYYPNGYLKLKGKRMGGGATMVGIWEYYDETGKLIKKVDEDAKFGKFDYNKLLLFLHQKEHLNLETGENRERVSFGFNAEQKHWGVTAIGAGQWTTKYIIDGETGEVIDKKEYQGGIE